MRCTVLKYAVLWAALCALQVPLSVASLSQTVAFELVGAQKHCPLAPASEQLLLGWNNRTCDSAKGVGPMLRASSISIEWHAWDVTFVSGHVARLRTHPTPSGPMLCDGAIIVDNLPNCQDPAVTVAASAPMSGSDLFAIRPVPRSWGGKPGEVNIIAKDRRIGCARFLSASANNCGDYTLKLVDRDDGLGLQRWVMHQMPAVQQSPGPSLPPPLSLSPSPSPSPSPVPPPPPSPTPPSPFPPSLTPPSPSPPSPTPPSPFHFPVANCSGHGESCANSALPCCNGLYCVLRPDYGYLCLTAMAPPPSPPPSPPPPPPPGIEDIFTFAGTGQAGYSGNGGPATSAQIYYPYGIAFDSLGNAFFSDNRNHIVQKVDAATANVSLVAGTAQSLGFSGDNGPATSAKFASPAGMAFDTIGNLYVVDSHNNRVRMVNLSSGNISTVVGSGRVSNSLSNNNCSAVLGNGLSATSAHLCWPTGLTFDTYGNMYIADNANNQIRMVNKTTGIISTVAGTGAKGFFGDDGPATSADLYAPTALNLDSYGNLYIADYANNVVRMINMTTGNISTVAGEGSKSAGYSGDGGPATNAQMNGVQGVALDSMGNIYIADYSNYVVRMVNTTTGNISTVVGTGSLGYSGDGGPATNAQITGPNGIGFDSLGRLYIETVGSIRIYYPY